LCFKFIWEESDACDKDLFFTLIISELFCSIWVFIPIFSNTESELLLLDTLSCELLFLTKDEPKLLLSNISLLLDTVFCDLLFPKVIEFFSHFFFYFFQGI